MKYRSASIFRDDNYQPAQALTVKDYYGYMLIFLYRSRQTSSDDYTSGHSTLGMFTEKYNTINSLCNVAEAW